MSKRGKWRSRYCATTLLQLALSSYTVFPGTLHQSLVQEQSSPKPTVPPLPKPLRTRIAFLWSILLPTGYKIFQTDNLRDAWYGVIESTEDSFRVSYTAGLVQSPFEVDKDQIVWTKPILVDKFTFQYGLKRTGKTETLIASMNGLYFSTQYRTDADLERFLTLVKACAVGNCKDCLPTPTLSQSSPAKRKAKPKVNHVSVK